MKWVSLGCMALSLVAAPAQEKVGFDLNWRGLEASARGDYAEAERILLEAVKVWRALGPAYAAHLATTQTNLAQAFSGQGKRREATNLLEQSVAEFRKA